jgi:Leucine-rich repeat (LRR) protein
MGKNKDKRTTINKLKSNGPAACLSFASQGLYSAPIDLLSTLSPASITSLNLSSNLLSVIPDEVSQLRNIEVLNVADNYIRYFPKNSFSKAKLSHFASAHLPTFFLHPSAFASFYFSSLFFSNIIF